MSNTFGTHFRITSFGESHGGAVGVVVDGCPALLPLSEADIQPDLDRRRPGQSSIVTQRNEGDQVQILSGVFEGQTIGTPICMMVSNQDARPEAYETFKDKFRPSHADYTYEAKYGTRNWQGGGRSSARETIGRVAAAAIAKKLLGTKYGVEIVAWVSRVQDVISNVEMSSVKLSEVESNIVRCPDPIAAENMIQRIEQIRKDGNSVGGAISCVARNVPPGWGEPVFDKMEALLAHAMLSLPASKGFEIGSGFAGTFQTGIEHNDEFVMDSDGIVRTKTNRSGGIQGGISNGEMVYFSVGFKPTATVMKEQETVTSSGEPTTLTGRGRHDPCVLPRAVPMVEAMTALVLADLALRNETSRI